MHGTYPELNRRREVGKITTDLLLERLTALLVRGEIDK